MLLASTSTKRGQSDGSAIPMGAPISRGGSPPTSAPTTGVTTPPPTTAATGITALLTIGIPGLRDDPKIVGRDDAKVVGDSVAKAVPFFGNSSPKEAQDCRSELGEGFIASIIGDMSVHYAPASFDRIKMRTIGRDEVQPDPASRLPQPLTH